MIGRVLLKERGMLEKELEQRQNVWLTKNECEIVRETGKVRESKRQNACKRERESVNMRVGERD